MMSIFGAMPDMKPKIPDIVVQYDQLWVALNAQNYP